jgi:hypothetical protein
MTCCVVCGRRCVPLADYDVPVCIRCDKDVEFVQVRAAIGDALEQLTVLVGVA